MAEEKSIVVTGVPENKQDLGLGLTDFLKPSSKPEVKTESKKEETKDGSFRKTEKAEEERETSTNNQPETKAKEEKKEKEGEVRVDDNQPGDKKQEQEKGKKESGKDGEGDTDGKASDTKGDDKVEKKDDFEKRYKDTAKWANKIHQENIDLKKEFEVLKKKFDGTYDEEAEKSKGTEDSTELSGRLTASLAVAEDRFGQEFIETNINGEDSPYQEIRNKMPYVDERVKAADLPFVEAVQALKEHQFFEKWGRDTEQIVENIKKSIEPELRKQITREIQEKITKKESIPDGIGKVKGAAGTKEEDDNGFKPKSLADILTG